MKASDKGAYPRLSPLVFFHFIMFELYSHIEDGCGGLDWLICDIGTYRQCIDTALHQLDADADLDFAIAKRSLPTTG